MSDEDCRAFVRRAFVHRPWLTLRAPILVGVMLLVCWPTLVLVLLEHVPGVRGYVPLPRSTEGVMIFLIVTTVALAIGVPLIVRDWGVYLGLQDEVHRAAAASANSRWWAFPFNPSGPSRTRRSSLSAARSAGRSSYSWTSG